MPTEPHTCHGCGNASTEDRPAADFTMLVGPKRTGAPLAFCSECAPRIFIPGPSGTMTAWAAWGLAPDMGEEIGGLFPVFSGLNPWIEIDADGMGRGETGPIPFPHDIVGVVPDEAAAALGVSGKIVGPSPVNPGDNLSVQVKGPPGARVQLHVRCAERSTDAG